MSSSTYVVFMLMTLAGPAAAQSTTERGIRALLSGDDREAVRILRPLADDPGRPDPAAQFFLAILHDTGHASHRARACTLFLRAAQQPGPFAKQSAAIAAVIRDEYGAAASVMCAEAEGWQGGPPQAFVRGPGYTPLNVTQPATTADGVAALARGDYPRAIDILKPIAEDPWVEDAAAQFFMAGLYQSGDGVPVDPLKACALYERASFQSDNPFGQEASKQFAPFVSRGRQFLDECQALANVGLDSGFERATFDLGSGHYVEWTLSAATVTDKGRTKREPMAGMVPRGARFLPLQYTELATGPTRSLPRHFIEMFFWEPSGRSGPWKLRWFIFEVVRDEIIIVDTFDALTAENADLPPSRDAFNPRDYAVLRVNDEGNAEWAVLKGAAAFLLGSTPCHFRLFDKCSSSGRVE